MRSVFLFLVLTSVSSVWAHKAHVHGEGTLGLAFDGSKGKLIFDIPGEAIMGFEHRPKKGKDIKARDEAFAKFESSLEKMVIFPEELKCQFKKNKLSLQYHDGHAEVVADFAVNCEKTPEGHSIEFHFAKVFPQIKKVRADILIGELQKSIEILEAGAKVELR